MRTLNLLPAVFFFTLKLFLISLTDQSIETQLKFMRMQENREKVHSYADVLLGHVNENVSTR
jgi:hypothetical protein